MFRLLRSIPSDFKGGVINKCDILLVAQDSSRVLHFQSQEYASYIDSAGDYFEQAGCKCMTLADRGSIKVGKKAYRSPISINGWHLLSFFKIPFYSGKTLLIKKYIRIFKESNCKVIVATIPSKALCNAANIAGIPVFELMHGAGYQENYIEKLYIKGKTSVDIPNFFVCFDKVTYISFLRFFDSNQMIGVKNYLLSRFSSMSTLGIPNEWRIKKEIKSQMAGYKKTVLVSLQWGFDGEREEFKGIVSNGVIHNSIINAISATEHDILWILRLHPVQWGPSYKRHVNLVMELEKNNKNVICKTLAHTPLPEVINYCDSHITASSMTCYEAAWLGVKSYAFSPIINNPDTSYINYFRDIEKAGLLIRENIKEEKIIEFILMTSKQKPMPFYFNEDFRIVTNFIKHEYL